MAKTKIHYPQWKSQAGSTGLDGQGERDKLVDMISLTAEACGQSLSPAAAEMLADDLSNFDDAAILAALARCRFELDGPLRIVEVLARIDDGRPDADEAWSMMPADEHDSIVWTDEMAQAWGVAQAYLDEGDIPAAQQAFRKAYEKLVLEARIRCEAPRWTPSLGLDVSGREQALRDAVKKGRATAAQVEPLLGHPLRMTGQEDEFAIRDKGDIKSLH